MTDKEYIQKLEQENATLRREVRLVKLRRQVTPHFLFNSLSVAMSLVVQSPRIAVKFLRHLASMYRYLLNYGNEYHVPIEQEMEMLQQYYELMSIRHVNCIKLEISKEVRKLKHHPLPPLALQGLLENAIKHNVHTEEQPLTVFFREERSYLVVSNKIAPLISDSSLPLGGAGGGLGLAYMNETMQLLFGQGIEVINDGDSFTVKIPLL